MALEFHCIHLKRYSSKSLEIKFLKLVENCEKKAIISALKITRKNVNKWPKAFHAVHGTRDYALINSVFEIVNGE